MRPLVLAAALAALAGCSLPYQGTSFKALPKPQPSAEGEHHETASAEEGEKKVNIASQAGDAFSDVPSNHGAYEKSDEDRVSVVFPNTAQPTAIPLTSGAGYAAGDAPSTTEE